MFVGEIDGNAPMAPVSGFHNWIRYYMEEKAGRAIFRRWKGQTEVGFWFKAVTKKEKFVALCQIIYEGRHLYIASGVRYVTKV